MNTFLATLIFAALFILRFIVPLGILLGFTYLVNRMQNHWQADSSAAGT